MSSKVQIMRRVNGAAGSPPAPGFNEGELALNFPGAAGAAGTPEFWAHDGSAWRRINPPAGAITTQSVDLNTPGGATVGAAATAWVAANAAFSGDIVIATYGTPAQAYVLTTPGSPGVDTSWTGLGGAVSFATAAEIHAGTSTTKALNPAILRGEALNAPSATPANDANRLIRLNAQGHIDSGFLNVSSLTYRGNADLTAAYTAPATAWAPGDFATVQTTGTAVASWPGLTGNEAVNAGDLAIWDGTNFHIIANEVDLTAYLALAGGTMADGAAITFDTTTGGPGSTILNGDDGTLDAVRIDGGTY